MSMLSDLDTSENPPSGGTQPHLTPERSQSEQCSNSAISHRVIQPHSQWSGFKIVGDNLDKTVKPRHMRSDHQNVSLHYFHSIAVTDRIDFSNLPDTPPAKPTPSLKSVSQSLLPTSTDNQILRKNFTVHISRILAQNMPFISHTFSDVIDWHISHQYSKEMARKSEVVSYCISHHYSSLLGGC
jgi:L1 cell adhesion molecule like protein